jgi:tubulin polyglutamylase TTLL9
MSQKHKILAKFRDESDSDDDNDRVKVAEERRLERATYYGGCIKQWKERKRNPRGDMKLRQIRFRCPLRNTILDVLKRKGYRETESETDWDIFWAPRPWIRGVYDKVRLDSHQRVNHFRNYYELTRKDFMLKNLKRMRRGLQREGKEEEASHYEFWPETFHLPSEYLVFVEEFKRKPDYKWIMKPIGSCQGKGIFLFDKLKDIQDWKNNNRWAQDNPNVEKYVVQQYIANPLLVGSKKFDMRLYALVTTYQPPEIYVYKEGFCRFSTVRFAMDAKNTLEQDDMHLTNVAVQKKSAGYDEESGGKWSIRALKLYLVRKYGQQKTNKVFAEINDCVVRSQLSVQKIMINDRNSFALYGYDIMIDDNLKVWLIEINACPSLTASTPADWKLKTDMLHDMLSIVIPDGVLQGDETQVGGWDLIYRNGWVDPDPHMERGSTIGNHNDRDVQLKRLFKQIARKRYADTKERERLEKERKENKDKSAHERKQRNTNVFR